MPFPCHHRNNHRLLFQLANQPIVLIESLLAQAERNYPWFQPHYHKADTILSLHPRHPIRLYLLDSFHQLLQSLPYQQQHLNRDQSITLSTVPTWVLLLHRNLHLLRFPSIYHRCPMIECKISSIPQLFKLKKENLIIVILLCSIPRHLFYHSLFLLSPAILMQPWQSLIDSDTLYNSLYNSFVIKKLHVERRQEAKKSK
jgi:hypothetical protein